MNMMILRFQGEFYIRRGPESAEISEWDIDRDSHLSSHDREACEPAQETDGENQRSSGL